MEYSKFKSILKTAKISIKDFAEILNQNPRSITNYSANGFVPNHFSVIAKLIAELHLAGKDAKALLKKCDHKKES
jgi:Asp-tRNA(Asn)/Glu-tRNA(Gln) amidotransferase B subunit